jgi:hypothetical protein
MQTLHLLFIGLFWPSCCFAWSGKIVFEENFNGNTLDESKWEYQEACDNSKYMYAF